MVWEQLAESTHEESTLTITYAAFMVIATMIAACGVVLDNAILIVGAMAVGPEFGPLAGICTGLVQRRPRLAGRSLAALAIGFTVAIAATTLFSLLMTAFGLFQEGMLENPGRTPASSGSRTRSPSSSPCSPGSPACCR